MRKFFLNILFCSFLKLEVDCLQGNLFKEVTLTVPNDVDWWNSLDMTNTLTQPGVLGLFMCNSLFTRVDCPLFIFNKEDGSCSFLNSSESTSIFNSILRFNMNIFQGPSCLPTSPIVWRKTWKSIRDQSQKNHQAAFMEKYIMKEQTK